MIKAALPRTVVALSDLAVSFGDAVEGLDGNPQIHQRLLQSAPPILSTGLQKSRRFRKESG